MIYKPSKQAGIFVPGRGWQSVPDEQNRNRQVLVIEQRCQSAFVTGVVWTREIIGGGVTAMKTGVAVLSVYTGKWVDFPDVSWNLAEHLHIQRVTIARVVSAVHLYALFEGDAVVNVTHIEIQQRGEVSPYPVEKKG